MSRLNLFVIILLVCNLNVLATIPYAFITDKDYYRLTNITETYVDSTNTFLIQDILSNAFDENFCSNSETDKIKIPGNNYTNWIRIALKNSNRYSRSMILEFDDCTIDKIQLYQIKNNILKTFDETGDNLPFETRAVFSKNFAFDINIEPFEIIYLYIKISNKSSTNNFSINLFSASEYIGGKGISYFLNGMYYSFLLFLLILMIILVAVFPEVNLKSNLYFIFIISFLALWSFAIDGLGFQYLWSYTPAITETLLYFLPFVSVFFLIPFLNETFETQQNHPKHYNIMRFSGYLLSGIVLLTFYLNLNLFFVKIEFMLLSITVIFFTIKMIKQIAYDRIFYARFYLYSVLISIIWVTTLIISIFVEINVYKYEIFFKIIISIQLILLSLGQIYIIKQKFTKPIEKAKESTSNAPL